MLAYTAEHKHALEARVEMKPEFITPPGQYSKTAAATVSNVMGVVPNVDVREVSAGCNVVSCYSRLGKESLENKDLAQIGRLELRGAVK